MERVDVWPESWQKWSVAGASLGLAMHVEPGTVARWAMMLGLAVTTVAVWTVLDSALFAGRESADYRRWAAGIGAPLYLVGLIAYVIAGSLYVFGTWLGPLKQEMFSGPHLILTVLTAVGPGLALLLVLMARRGATPLLAILAGVAQLGALALHAISRQVVQNLKLADYMLASADPPNYQWDVLILFLLLFVGGIVLVVWMIGKAAAAYKSEITPSR